MTRKEALLILNLLPGIGPWRKKILVQSFGAPEKVLDASLDDLYAVAGLGKKQAEELARWRQAVPWEKELDLAGRSGVTILTEDDERYPAQLKQIHDPPICLYACGELSLLQRTEMALAIVGSRSCTSYGRKMAARFAEDASRAGWPVVSGLARGIDTAAHESTLDAGGKTIAVIGGGLAEIYPRENIALAYRISQQGGVILSEFPMNYRPDKKTFPMRNRIISGICRGTLVIEAGLQSGSLITAAQAMEQGRTVFAVPGRVDTPYSAGCHALLRDGAVLAESFEDLVNEYTLLPGLKAPPQHSQATPPPPADALHLTGLDKKLWDILRTDQAQDIDQLIDLSNEEPQCVMASLLSLELKRLVRQLPGRQLQLLR